MKTPHPQPLLSNRLMRHVLLPLALTWLLGTGIAVAVAGYFTQQLSGLKDRYPDVVLDIRGKGLAIDNPNAPKPVQEISVRDADDLVRAGNITLVDVRPADERAIAAVGVPFKSFDGNGRAALEALPKDTALAFMCHHGGRSAQAAELFRALGFTKVFNVTGGINAWSEDVDNGVPKY